MQSFFLLAGFINEKAEICHSWKIQVYIVLVPKLLQQQRPKGLAWGSHPVSWCPWCGRGKPSELCVWRQVEEMKGTGETDQSTRCWGGKRKEEPSTMCSGDSVWKGGPTCGQNCAFLNGKTCLEGRYFLMFSHKFPGFDVQKMGP